MTKSIEIIDKKKCTGCGSCFHSCPTQSISMVENSEGFLYPLVDERCISCGICIKHCPILTPIQKTNNDKEIYGLILKNDDILFKSSSGGVFPVIAEYVINNKGYVFGCALNNDLEPEHIAINNINELYKLQGSKYVESNLGDCFPKIRNYLSNGCLVLFTGTPCQAAGLISFLGKPYNNLITIDLVCHGIPSRKLFSSYITWLSKKNNDQIIQYNFRDKKNGWGLKGSSFTKNKNIKVNPDSDPYYFSFLRGDTYRESCYKCSYASMNRNGDFTIGDFWGVDKFFPLINTKKGVSVCILNTEKACALFTSIKSNFIAFPCTEDQIIKYNHNLNSPTNRPLIREEIYNNLNTLEPNLFFKTIKTVPLYMRLFKEIYRLLFPISVRKKIRRIIKK